MSAVQYLSDDSDLTHQVHGSMPAQQDTSAVCQRGKSLTALILTT
jgi:hypothetical protein